MQESRFERRNLRYPELDNFHLSRKSIGRTKTRQINHYLRKRNNEFEARHSSSQIQNQEKQHPILNLYSKTTKQVKKDKKNQSMSRRMFSSSSNKGSKKDLGHDLHQLTKGNQQEANLSPHPSLTIMVQPNKIDYTKRSISKLPLPQLFV